MPVEVRIFDLRGAEAVTSILLTTQTTDQLRNNTAQLALNTTGSYIHMNFQQDVVSGEQYRYALTNFRIAHEKVELQRAQLQEQEKQVAALRARIALLEGDSGGQSVRSNRGGSSVDDFSIKNTASKLEKLINRWAADTVQRPSVSLNELRSAILSDVVGGYDPEPEDASPILVQSLLRHAMSEVISDAIINTLVVTNSIEANTQLTRLHEHLFTRDPTIAGVWRRQTFSAGVETVSQEMSDFILSETLPVLMTTLSLDGSRPAPSCTAILDEAYVFSRMLHGSSSSTIDPFYRAFVPELGSILHPRQIELTKRCQKSERGEVDRVGATIFPGLVKVQRLSNAATASRVRDSPTDQTVVRRAQVICECALGITNTLKPPEALNGGGNGT